MKETMIMLATINDTKEFTNIASEYDFEIDLSSGRYSVDAKSIMGIFSLDLTKPLKVSVHTDNPGNFYAAIQKFIVA